MKIIAFEDSYQETAVGLILSIQQLNLGLMVRLFRNGKRKTGW
ncbi:hypothetical protein [Streptococcus devriesei]|nr:hypothetical protein [Streptococcus devriesei]